MSMWYFEQQLRISFEAAKKGGGGGLGDGEESLEIIGGGAVAQTKSSPRHNAINVYRVCVVLLPVCVAVCSTPECCRCETGEQEVVLKCDNFQLERKTESAGCYDDWNSPIRIGGKFESDSGSGS